MRVKYINMRSLWAEYGELNHEAALLGKPKASLTLQQHLAS